MTIIFAAYDDMAAPLAGLTPAWDVLYDAATGLPISATTFVDLGSGLYKIGSGLTASSAGIVDLGVTALPRYIHVDADSPNTLAAYDGSQAPLAGLVPVWDSFVDDAGAPQTPATFTELAGGLYRINYSGPAVRAGVIDLGATAIPRYYSWEFSPFNADPPTITNMVPAPGDIDSGSVLAFDVEDVDPGLLKVILTLKYAARSETIVVHDGTEFKPPFDSVANVRSVITDGFHYVIHPAGGWTGGFTLEVCAVDSAGNLAP